MKKLIAVILTVALVLALGSCAAKKADEGDRLTPDHPSVPQENDGEGSASTDDNNDVSEGGKDEPQDVETPEDGAPDTQAPEDGSREGGVNPGMPLIPVPGSEGDVGGEDPGDGGFPSIMVPGQDGGEAADVPVTDAGDLVDKLAGICEGRTGEMMVENYSLSSSVHFSNWFNGMEYTEGTKVAVNSPLIGSIAHLILLIEPAEGVDAEEYAKELEANANPRWQICVEAESVKYAVKDGLILFVMTNSDIADDVIEAFNG